MTLFLVDSVFAEKAWEMLMAIRLEICLFCGAVLTYFVLFGNTVPRNVKVDSRSKGTARRIKSTTAFRGADDEDELPEDVQWLGAGSSPPSPRACAEIEASFQAAYEANDFRGAFRHWTAMKRFARAPSVSLARVVETIQRLKKDTQLVLRELKAFMKRYPREVDISSVNDLLESLARRMDSDLLSRVVDLLPLVELKMDSRSYEIVLGMHFSLRNFNEVTSTVAEMRANQVPLSTRSSIVLIKTALRQGNFEEARRCLRDIKSTWIGPKGLTTCSTAPRQIVSQLVELACKEHQLAVLLPEIADVPLTEEAVNAMLNECVWQRDPALVSKVEELARHQGLSFSDRTYGLLLRSATGNAAHAKQVLDEVLEREVTVTPDLAMAALAVCSSTGDIGRADLLRKKLRSTQASVLGAFVRFYAENDQNEKACDVYEQDLRTEEGTTDCNRRTILDPRLERVLMTAALRCGRTALAHGLLASSPSDVAKHIAMVRNCAVNGNLPGAMKAFESLRRSGTELNSIVYNTVLDACVECKNLRAAEDWMRTTKEAGMADVVSHNTLIKAHLQDGNFQKARSIIEDMKNEGLQPNRVTFNELINYVVNKGGGGALHGAMRSQIWSLIGEMQTVGVKPNQVTCSILLKSLNSSSCEADIYRTMDLISSMEEPMDEVLLSSVVEACVRVGKPDLLASKLKQLQNGASTVNGSHTFGSLIKAYGHARDIDGVWRCWKEMRSRHIRPTSITLGCMVEAVVSNGDAEGAYELIHQVQEDEQCRDALNSVIFCSVLKGFAREKQIERVWAVYEEMCNSNVEMSVVTYNTMVDACARSGRMDRVPSILEDMGRFGIKPNVITYSTMLKGHCQQGDIHAGFRLLEEMKRSDRLRPDEIVYNSLMDGCAQNGLVDEGLGVLAEMQTAGVQPSNFTLSVLVKLMSRARRLDQAFSLVEQLTTKYNFSPNVHVYTNLAQACISNKSLTKAVGLLEKMVQNNVQPIGRTYNILIRASLQRGEYSQADGLLRGALGLPGALPFLAAKKAISTPSSFDYAVVNETLVCIAEIKELALSLVSDIKQFAPKVRIDAATQRRLMMPEGAKQPQLGPMRGGGSSGGFGRGGEGGGYGGGRR